MNRYATPSSQIYDVIGIGLGPFNLGMAALLDSVPDVTSLFFEKEKEFNWHPNMLIEGTTLQVPFLADLVSMADVKNHYSFLNYLQEHNRLYQFYFYEKFHIPRKEYNHYCRWVSEQLGACQFGKNVRDVIPFEKEGEQLYQLNVMDEETQTMKSFFSRNIVVGIGTVPAVPEPFHQHLGSTVFHTSDYLANKNNIGNQSVVVIGSGQSAAEVFLDVARLQQEFGGRLEWYTRSKGFFPMEYSKLGLEYFSPDYTDFFYKLSQQKKDELIKEQDLLYKGISAETISDIYDHLYERSIGNEQPPIHLQAMTEMTDLEKNYDMWKLKGVHRIKNEPVIAEADIVIFGTGYKPAVPTFLNKMKEWVKWDAYGRFHVKRGYGLDTALQGDGEIFIQNGEIHTHGVGAPDLGLGAHRNAVIINQLAKREVYKVERKNVFQTFESHQPVKQPQF
ncbi:lysine N(6)-hydroxylase/L-ornithine N(5)-oxygenase family protein [Halobacillus mangrovi]|uniref:lysine N(6)-hydroxylase/L-ornithine N(5)-oxygenase family protein n=1 Tax=Halobacillus mangrovi TaxID=402384 RepID=UPI003D99D190